MPSKRKAIEPGWDKIGMMVGRKIDRKFKNTEWQPLHKWPHYHKMCGGGFFGRALFIIGLLIALNSLGMMKEVNIWIQALIGVGFALMRLD